MQMTGVWHADQYYKEQKSCPSLVGVLGNDLTGPLSKPAALSITTMSTSGQRGSNRHGFDFTNLNIKVNQVN